MKHSEQLNELSAALAIAQGRIRAAAMSGYNPHFKSRYSTLEDVWDACRGPLAAQGLSVVQSLETSEKDELRISTLILHASGQWIESTLTLLPKDASPQSFGSAASYGRRYALESAVGVVSDEDDDGNAATRRKQSHDAPEAAKTVPPSRDLAKSEPMGGPATEARLRALQSLQKTAKDYQWNPEEVTQVIRDHFGVDSSKSLSTEQIVELDEMLAHLGTEANAATSTPFAELP